MFGDIITDLAAMIQGGMGIAASGNINPDGVSMFEPISGSAPKYTGMNIINPIAAISAGQILLETIGEPQAALRVEQGIKKALREDIRDMAAGKMGHSTQEVGDLVASYIANA
jgi:3-isopropylmalate dehydrogenase